jgi:hypothetical protein
MDCAFQGSAVLESKLLKLMTFRQIWLKVQVYKIYEIVVV